VWWVLKKWSKGKSQLGETSVRGPVNSLRGPKKGRVRENGGPRFSWGKKKGGCPRGNKRERKKRGVRTTKGYCGGSLADGRCLGGAGCT